jgi:hypothetical protein
MTLDGQPAAGSICSLAHGFTRVRHLKRPKSDKSDVGWERGGAINRDILLVADELIE